jgi:hypothetical protein
LQASSHIPFTISLKFGWWSQLSMNLKGIQPFSAGKTRRIKGQWSENPLGSRQRDKRGNCKWQQGLEKMRSSLLMDPPRNQVYKPSDMLYSIRLQSSIKSLKAVEPTLLMKPLLLSLRNIVSLKLPA